MNDLELYKLLMTEDNRYETALADELGWSSKDEFLVWVSYVWINEFVAALKTIFGENLFDDGGFDGNFQSSGVCIDLKKALDGYDIELTDIFPKGKYDH